MAAISFRATTTQTAITVGAVSGGTPPYSHAWTTPGGGMRNPTVLEDKTNLKAGETYTLTITDSAANTLSAPMTPLPYLSEAAQDSSTSGQSSFTVTTTERVQVGCYGRYMVMGGSSSKRVMVFRWDPASSIAEDATVSLVATNLRTAASFLPTDIAVTATHYTAGSDVYPLDSTTAITPLAYGSGAKTATATEIYVSSGFSVFINRWNGSAYASHATIAMPAGGSGGFGSTMKAEGDAIAIHASGHASGAGCVYVFRRNVSGVHVLEATFTSPIAATGTPFGTYLDFDGSNLIVSLFGVPDQFSAAVVYTRDSGTLAWSAGSVLKCNPTTATTDRAGTGVAVFENSAWVYSDKTGFRFDRTGPGSAWKLSRLRTASRDILCCGLARNGNLMSLVLRGGIVCYITPLPVSLVRVTADVYQIVSPATSGSILNVAILGGRTPYQSTDWYKGGVFWKAFAGGDETGLVAAAYSIRVVDAAGLITTVAVATIAATSQITIRPGTITMATSASGLAIINIGGSLPFGSTIARTSTVSWSSSTGGTYIPPWETFTAQQSVKPGSYTLTIRDTSCLNAPPSTSFTWDVPNAPSMALTRTALTSDPAAQDRAGGYVTAVSGLYMAMGVPRKTVNSYTNAGAVYLYRKAGYGSADAYAFLQKLVSPTSNSSVSFGSNVCMHGDALAVHQNGSDAVGDYGKIYLYYRRSGDVWTLETTVGDSSSASRFNSSVTLYENTMAHVRAATIRVYARSGTAWSAGQIIAGPAELVTTPVEPSLEMHAGGMVLRTLSAVHVYTKAGSTWSLQQTVPVPGTTRTWGALHAQGEWIAACSSEYTPLPAFYSFGRVYMFRSTDGVWAYHSTIDQVFTMGTSPTVFAEFARSCCFSGGDLLISLSPSDLTSVTVPAPLYAFDGTSWKAIGGYLPPVGSNSSLNGAVRADAGLVCCGSQYHSGTSSYQGAVYSGVSLVLAVAGGTVTSTSAPQASDGAIAAITVSGGVSPYAYSWTSSLGTTVPGATTAAAKTGLAAATYTVAVVDAVAARLTRTFTVPSNAVIACSGGAVVNVNVYGQATGSIGAVTVSGGGGGYVYAWTSGAGASAISTPTTAAAKTGLRAGSYYLQITDARSVTVTQTYTITQNPQLVLTAGIKTDPKGLPNGAITASTLVGGTGIYTIAWTNSGAGSVAVPNPTSLSAKTGLTPGIYVLSVSDSVAATATTTYTLVDTYVTMSVAAPGALTHASAYNAVNGAIGPPAIAGGLLPAVYSWTSSPGASDVASVGVPQLSNVKAGTYVLRILDATSRSLHITYEVGQPLLLAETHVNHTRTAPGSIAITAKGGLGGNYQYSWTLNGSAFTPTSANLGGA